MRNKGKTAFKKLREGGGKNDFHPATGEGVNCCCSSRKSEAGLAEHPWRKKGKALVPFSGETRRFFA